MSDFPGQKQIADRLKTNIKNNIPASEPFSEKTIWSIVMTSLSQSFYSVYRYIQNVVIRSIFPFTASSEIMESIWGAFYGLTKDAATQSSGIVIFAGVGTIPISTIIVDSESNTYTTQSSISALSVPLSVSTLTQTGGLATATLAGDHNLATGMSVVISGANETEYNGTFTITAISATAFTYAVDGGAASPATGTIIATVEYGFGEVISDEFGSALNQDAGATLTLTIPISGIDNTAYVNFDGLTGGTDIETNTDYNSKVISEYQNPTNYMSEAFVKAQVLTVEDITRAWIKPITPTIGYFTVYSVKDNESSIALTATDIANIKALIATFLPVTQNIDTRVLILSPTLQPVNFTFTVIDPNTATMQAAIENNLSQFFIEQSNVGEDILSEKYNGAIINTIDTQTGEVLKDFSLSTPVGDIGVVSGNLATLGTITF